MTDQEIFTKVATHLLTQNKQSLSESLQSCRYRGMGGTMCAVGCLITDDAYDREIEGYRSSSGVVIMALEESGIDGRAAMDLLHDLQFVHDRTPVANWQRELLRVAEKHDLEMPDARYS